MLSQALKTKLQKPITDHFAVSPDTVFFSKVSVIYIMHVFNNTPSTNRGISKTHLIRDAVFPLGRFFSANQRFVGARANNFWQHVKHSFRKLNKLVEV